MIKVGMSHINNNIIYDENTFWLDEDARYDNKSVWINCKDNKLNQSREEVAKLCDSNNRAFRIAGDGNDKVVIIKVDNDTYIIFKNKCYKNNNEITFSEIYNIDLNKSIPYAITCNKQGCSHRHGKVCLECRKIEDIKNLVLYINDNEANKNYVIVLGHKINWVYDIEIKTI